MTISKPRDLLDKFGLEFTASYTLVVEAINRIYATGQLRARSYTVATLPDASTVSAGSMVYVSDAAGTPCIAFSDGTNWQRCDDASVTVT
jgi:hypothetical protein